MAPTVQPPAAIPFCNPLDSLLGYQLRRASAVVLADLAGSLDTVSLRPAEASVLLLIDANPGIKQSDIGRLLGIQRANMAPITATLDGRGLIERSRPDGRSHGLKLSADGQALAADVGRTIDLHEARFLPDLDAAERAVLTALVRRIWTV